MKRMSMVIKIKGDQIEAYKRLHANVWPDILAMISKCNITNYSIFLKEPENLLIGYWEYLGDDFDADAKLMSDDPLTQKWWDICMPMQTRLDSAKEGEWWSMMEEVFHHD